MVYTSRSRTFAFFSFIFCMVPLYSADAQRHDPIDPFLENLTLSLGARYIDDPATLVSLSCVNKGMRVLMSELNQARRNELKDYIAKHGTASDQMVYIPNRLRAYYLVNGGTKNVGSVTLVSLSHYGNECKKEVITHFNNLSFYTAQLAEKFKPRVIGDACYMYDAYVEEEKNPGTFVRVLHTGKVEYVHAYCAFYNKHAPSGWIAGFLPKLHDELINNATYTYYPWDECTKGDLKKIKKEVDKMGGQGDVI